MRLIAQKKMKKSNLCFAIASLLASCNNAPCPEQQPPVGTVLLQEDQAKLTPQDVLLGLAEGNKRFCSGELTVRDHSRQVRLAAKGQFPKAVVLSCLDSRIPVEDVFDKGIGDLFVARVAGNVVNEDILGSMEFGCAVAGAKLVVVMGHENCGAVKAAIDNVQTGHIASLVHKIRGSMGDSLTFGPDRTAKNAAYVHHVCVQNVRHTVDVIRQRSILLEDLEKKGKLKIVGAVYDLDTGIVTFLE